MKLALQLVPRGDVAQRPVAFDLDCGSGKQTLAWLGYAGCAQLAQLRGNTVKKQLPQTVMGPNGTPQDPHIVINELFTDGDEVLVEYSDGPVAFSTRWQGRPRTPPFRWAGTDEIRPSQDEWIHNLNLREFATPGLLGPGYESIQAADLKALKEALIKASGPLQAVFLMFQLRGEESLDCLSRLSLLQLRSMLATAKVVDAGFGNDKIDASFSQLEASHKGKCFKTESSGPGHLNFLGFLIALIHIASHKFPWDMTAECPLTQSFQRLLSLHVELYLLPEIARKVDKLKACITPKVLVLLEKGRKLTLQALAACQFKRFHGVQIQVELKYLCNHLTRWKLLGKEFSLEDLGAMVIFAQQSSVQNFNDYALQDEPLRLNCLQFENLLAAISFFLYALHKRRDHLEDFLGEFLDDIYRKTGVLSDNID